MAARLSTSSAISALESRLSPERRYIDLAVRLVVYERDGAALREVARSRVFGGRWDSWLRGYSPDPPDPASIVDIPVSRKQFEIATSAKPHMLVHAGRGSGKSHGICVWMLITALEIPHGSGQFISPTTKKSRILWRKMLKNLPTIQFLRSGRAGISKQPPVMTFRNGFTLSFETALADAAGCGEDNDALAFDERQAIKQQVVNDAVLTCRKAGGYRMIQIGTPDIDSEFYEDYERYKERPETCEIQHFTSYDNPFSSHEVFDNEKERMGSQLYDEQIGGNWVSSSGAVYWMFSRRKHVLLAKNRAKIRAHDITIDKLRRFRVNPTDPHYSLVIGVDYPRRAIVGMIYDDGRAGGLYVFDEIEMPSSSTPWQLADELKARGYENAVIFDDVGHGDNEARSESAIMRSQGFRVIHGKRNPRVKDRVNSVASKLGTADGHVSMMIDPKCERLIRCLERQQKGPDNKPDKTSDLDHFPDALGYAVWRLWPVRSLDAEERERQDRDLQEAA